MEATIDTAEVLRYLGYSGQNIDASLAARIEAAIADCERLLAPKGLWRVFPVRIDELAEADGEPCVKVLGTALTLPGHDICAHLAGAVSCALVAATLGPESEREMRRLSSRDPLAAMVFDAACSAYIEAGMDVLEEEVRAFGRQQGLHANGRFSPGYGDLPLAVQPLFLDVLQAQKRLGLSVTPAHMMVPTKSVTAIIGLFETAVDDTVQDRCACCPAQDDCAFRKKGMRCYGD